MPKDELERIESMSIIDVVAYINRLGMRLENANCTSEERKNGLDLLQKLTERVRFLKIRLKSGATRTMCSH